MAKRTTMTEAEADTCWRKLPESDRQFIRAMLIVSETVGDRELRFREISPEIRSMLQRANRDTLFSIITESVGLLTQAPVMGRIRKSRARNDTSPDTPVDTTEELDQTDEPTEP